MPRHVRGPQLDSLYVPVVARHLRRAVLLDDGVHRVAHDLGDTLVHVLAVEDGVALAVDGDALQVHDVVVFEDVLTGGEVHALHLALRALDGLGHHAGLDGHVVGHLGLLHHAADGVHAVAAEQAHEVVFERQVELRDAGVALTAGAAAQLVVDTARLVALGADDREAAGRDDAVVLVGADALRLGERGGAIGGGGSGRAALLHLVALVNVRVEAALAQHVVGQHVGIAAEQDVGTAAGHVRGDGHGAHAAGLRDDVGLALVVLRIEGLVLDAALVEQARELLGAFDGHRADEARLARRMALGHVVGHGVELRLHRAVDEVVLVLTRDGAVRRDGDDRQLVDLAEFGVLGHGRTGHARQLLVQAEVVLQRDGGERLVLLAHEHALFRLERLVQALGVAAALHDAAGELVDDLHLAVHHDVVHVAMEQELRLQRLLQVVRQLAGRVGVDVVDAQHGLDLLKAALGGVDGLLRLVHLEVHLGLDAHHDAGELVVRLGRLRARARDDERRAGLVDEDGVHLVDDGEVVSALHARFGARHHVVAQVVEAELRVRAVRDVGLIGGDLLVGAHAVLDEAHVHAEEAVHLAHPLAVAFRQVVVDGNHVHIVAGHGVQVAGQRGHERLAFAGFHLGDLPVVERHAADELHVEVAQPQRAHRGLAHGGERLGQDALEVLAVARPLAERGGERAELFVRACLHLRFKAVDLACGGFVVLELLALAKRQKLG